VDGGKKYNAIKTESARQFPLHLLKPREHGQGIRIIEKHIELSRKSIQRFARHVQRFLQFLDEFRSPVTEDYKKCAVDIAMKLETELKLSRFEVQYAIEGSNAPYLSALDVDMTAATKAGMAVSLVREAQKTMHTPIHRIAYVLVNYHGMPLNQESIDFLAERYGANRERLEKLLPEEGADTESVQSPPASVGETPPHMLAIHRLDSS